MKIDLQANYVLVLGESWVSWGEAVFNECKLNEIHPAFVNAPRCDNVLDYFKTDDEFEGARLTGRFIFEEHKDGLSIHEVYYDLFGIGEAIGAVIVSGQQIITLVEEVRKGLVKRDFEDSSSVLEVICSEVFTQEQQENGFIFNAADDTAQISACAVLTNCDFQKIDTHFGLVILSLFPESEKQNMNLFPTGALTMLSEGDMGALDRLARDIKALEKLFGDTEHIETARPEESEGFSTGREEMPTESDGEKAIEDVLQSITEKDLVIFKKMLEFTDEVDRLEPLEHFKRVEMSFRSQAGKALMETESYVLGKAGKRKPRYWIRRKGRGKDKPYLEFKREFI